MNTTFWAKPPQKIEDKKEIKVNFDEVEEIFFQKKEEIEKQRRKTVAVTSTKPKVVNILEPKKINNTAIVLSSFPGNTDNIIQSLRKCEDSL
mmetsp:Transcript_17545/g.15389  ORF Transcript_17545/g.15389 Transcript_17545/m.15389 type:complete len:92 (+) Transcript_17545:1984-2259(+)